MECSPTVGEILSRERRRHVFEHILNKYPIPRGRVADQHMGDGAHDPAVLHDRLPDRSVVNKGQQFYEKIFLSCFIFSSFGTENICTSLPIAAYLCSPIA